MAKALTHGHTMGNVETPEYQSWGSMKARCDNPNRLDYPLYGGRGITVCERWSRSFVAFLEDMGARPLGHTLDRIDPNGNYEPSNCRWATPQQQTKNRRPPGAARAAAIVVKAKPKPVVDLVMRYPEYSIWCAMRRRCTTTTNKDYVFYGGRGIKICERWDSFHTFIGDMGRRPAGTILARNNLNGDYEPGNCRWATRKEQRMNKRPND